MSIGFGPGSDMMKAYKANRNQLKRGKNFKEVSETYSSKENKKELKFKESSEEQLKEFRLKLKEQKRKENIRIYTVLGIITVVCAIGMYYFLFV